MFVYKRYAIILIIDAMHKWLSFDLYVKKEVVRVMQLTG